MRILLHFSLIMSSNEWPLHVIEDRLSASGVRRVHELHILGFWRLATSLLLHLPLGENSSIRRSTAEDVFSPIAQNVWCGAGISTELSHH
jgi:hypothetical protein